MKKLSLRHRVLLAAAAVNFVHGNPYIWTVFQPYVQREYGLSPAASSQPFTLIIGVFAAGNLAGGYLQRRLGARCAALLGSLFMCLGFLLAALAPIGIPGLISLGYGVIGGLGSGCAFSVLVAVPQSWFPDRRGLVTGITVGTVGLSGVLMNPLCDFLLSQYGYRISMLTVTAVYALLCTGVLFLKEAPEELSSDAPESRSLSPAQIIHTRVFYVLSVTMALAVPAYVLVNPLMKSLGMERGLSSSQALLGVTLASFANIAGRFVLPWLSDHCGRRPVLQGLYLLSAISVFGLIFAEGALFLLLCSCVCLVYGGVVSLFPVAVSDHFGTRYQSGNFGAVMAGYGLVSISCPFLLDLLGLDASLAAAGLCSAAGFWGLRYF